MEKSKMMQNELQVRICCNKSKVMMITIDGGNTPDVIVKICQDHISEHCFNNFVKYRKKIKKDSRLNKDSNIHTILKTIS